MQSGVQFRNSSRAFLLFTLSIFSVTSALSLFSSHICTIRSSIDQSRILEVFFSTMEAAYYKTSSYVQFVTVLYDLESVFENNYH